MCNYSRFNFIFYFSGKGLESSISKEVLPLNQPFSPLSSPLKKKEEETNFSSELFYGPSFFHEGTKTRKFACDEKQKETLSLSVQLCLVRCEKNPEPRFSREREKKRKKSGHPFPSKKKYKFGFFPE